MKRLGIWVLGRKRLMLGLMVVGAVFLIAGCEKWRLDKRMEELCAKDGGVHIYETVKLPPEMFDQNGEPFSTFRGGNVEDRFGPNYLYKRVDDVLKNGDPLKGEGRLKRVERQIIRKSDGAVLGSSVAYIRTGGDGIPMGHPSGRVCPDGKDTLVKEVFIREDR